jgi:hypothetical protein
MYTNSPYILAVAPHTVGGVPSSFAEICANTVTPFPLFSLLKYEIFN